MAAQLPIPIYTSLDQLYSDLGTATNHAYVPSSVREQQLTLYETVCDGIIL